MNFTYIFLMSPASGDSGSPGYMNLVFLLALFAVMYFFMIRPQTKKAKDQKNFLETLQKGDKIITVAGIHGRITRINENGTLEVEIDTNTKVMMERSGISMEYTRAIQNQPQTQK